MTGRTIATARWRALDREGEDHCRLCRADHGWLLIGHARFRDRGDGFSALDYVVRCNNAWQTLGADVTGLQEGLEVNLQIARDGTNWHLNGVPQPQVRGARDVDLSFSPATNLMPIRRLLASKDASEVTRAAWLRYPHAELQPLDQTYGRTGTAGMVAYSARQTGYATRLRADPSGFVTEYPGLWEGKVTLAA